MAYGTLYLQNKWYSSAVPRNPHFATATLTFDGNVADGETVTIGTQTFEFKTSGNAGAGKIKVDVSGGVTPDKAAAKLVEAITANSAIVTAIADEDESENDIVVVTYKYIGTEGNDISVATTATNGSWGQDVTKLTGGSYGTPSIMRNVVVYAAPHYYWCAKEGSETTVLWKRFTPEDY
jgi:phage tail sheath gpL-like